MVPTVFLSSTFADFEEEREILIEALPYIDVHVNCAERKGDGGHTLRRTVQDWIDESDMVVLLIGSRYGSESEEGTAWTEEEMQYAVSTGKRIFAYLRTPRDDHKKTVDVDGDKAEKLRSFIEMTEGHLAVVPRFKEGEHHKLVAIVIRDVYKKSQEIKADQQRADDADYQDSFV